MDNAVSDQLLKILRCPETHTALDRAEPSVVAAVNQAIASGTARNLAGEILARPLRGALWNADRSRLYPVLDHGPTLIADEAIDLPTVSLASSSDGSSRAPTRSPQS